MRILGEIALLVLGIGLAMVITRGLGPVAPALAGMLRVLINPIVLALLVALFVLFRMRRGSRGTKSTPTSSRELDGDHPRL